MLNNINVRQPQQFDSDSILHRMHNVLLMGIEQKCADLTVLFDHATKQDLQTIFPILVDNIFGPQGTATWDLRKIALPKNNMEYQAVMKFLKPEGPMFKLIYSLLLDVTIKYEFSLAYLPTKVRQMLEGLNVNPFYSEIIQYTNHQSGGRQIVSLLLNPFDYFIFNFVYHLINPCHQRVQDEENWNTAYYNLCAEYLLHFFPTGIDAQILPAINFYHGKNPIQSNQHMIRPQKQSTLLKANIFNDPQLNGIKMMHQHIEKHPRNDIWRSETLLMAIIDLWLSNDQVCSHIDSYIGGATYPDLPSDDYIRIIRITVKHLHAFASTAKYDNSSLGELKKHTLPMMQTRMYVFLRNLLHRWPLDESFRLILELWLSFIQPWRYANDYYVKRGGIYKDPSGQLNTQQQDDQPKYNDDDTYTQFIAENLLVYNVILQQLLPRFNRIDLASPKNAHMLFRLTKVFSQPNLVGMLRKIESLIENKNSPTHHAQLNYSSILPPLSPTSRWSSSTNHAEIYSSTQIMHDIPDTSFCGSNYEMFVGKYATLVRQKIYELEGPNFCYKPMFNAEVAREVYELLQLVKSCEIRAVQKYEKCKEKQKSDSSLWNLLFGQSQSVDEVPVADRQRAPLFLRCSAQYLIDIFEIKDFCNFDVTPEKITEFSTTLSSLGDNNSYPSILTPGNVKARFRNLKYDGDPDLIPIRSYEVAFIVRLMYVISSYLNTQYGNKFSYYYYGTNFWSRLAANFLQDPMQAFKYEKSMGSSRRVRYHLPPRVSLRKFAHQNFLFLFAVGTIVSVCLNYGWCGFLLLYICMTGLIACCRAIWSRGLRRRSPAMDINFNDSLDSSLN